MVVTVAPLIGSHGTFHFDPSGAVPGQLALLITSCERPSVMLKVFSYKSDLVHVSGRIVFGAIG